MTTSPHARSSTASEPPGTWPAPNLGDIVWCRFPNRDPADPTLKSRPALVVSVMDNAAPVRVRVAYGTTQRPIPYGRGEFLVQAPAHQLQAGLVSVTKFSMLNVVVLDWAAPWFGPAPLPGGLHGSTPVMGTLAAELVRELQRAHAETQPRRP